MGFRTQSKWSTYALGAVDSEVTELVGLVLADSLVLDAVDAESSGRFLFGVGEGDKVGPFVDVLLNLGSVFLRDGALVRLGLNKRNDKSATRR